MHLVNILDCEESTLFKQGTTFHSEVLIIAEKQIVLFHWPEQANYVTKQEYWKLATPEGGSPMIS